ncbi:MAG: trypsin-like peptidase domain-containing protein [Prochlorotrichaceae cyanobacterium]
MTPTITNSKVRLLRKYLPSFALGAIVALVSLSSVLSSQDAKGSKANGESALRDTLPSISDVADQLVPTVVSIQTTSYIQSRQPDMFGGDLFEFFMGPNFNRRNLTPNNEQRAVSGGSGVLISADGEIITNNHVIEGYEGSSRKSEVEVTLTNGKKYKGKILGRDKELDIALVKIDAKDLPFAKLGDSDAVRIGQWVVAIGNPFGLDHTVTQGILSARGRKLDTGISSFLQTDAAINRGNSGGPLINLKGEVIGINTAIAAQGQNIGFAVPSNSVSQILKTLRAGKPVSRGFLGIGPISLDSNYQEALGVSEGVVVGSVETGRPAAQAGLQRLDVITQVDRQAVKSPEELISIIASRRAGESVALEVIRDGKKMVINVLLGDRNLMTQNKTEEGPGEGTPEGDDKSPANIEKNWGFQIENLSPSVRAKYRIGEDLQGVVVTSVVSGSAASELLSPGWVITDVGRNGVKNIKEFQTQLQKAKTVLLVFVTDPRTGQRFSVAIPRR